jgi:NAD(P)-dependent dehydrogenase (short-subunit alcohol dehydrogenase family)
MGIFDGKVVIITGGNSGIGRATALAFARENARIVIGARRSEQGEEVVHEFNKEGAEGFFVRTDMSKPADVEALINKAVREYGRIDCAFNNAAIEGGMKLTADFTEDEFDDIMSVNLKGVWLCLKYEIQQMLNQEPAGGAIVNTSSVNGLGGVAQGSLYATTKAGVLALTKSAAQEYSHRGIRINALVAGAFRTPMLERVIERVSEGDPEKEKTAEAQYSQFIPVGRIGRPEEAAGVVLWLCSGAASYVSGHSMIVDGGLTSWAR